MRENSPCDVVKTKLNNGMTPWSCGLMCHVLDQEVEVKSRCHLLFWTIEKNETSEQLKNETTTGGQPNKTLRDLMDEKIMATMRWMQNSY